MEIRQLREEELAEAVKLSDLVFRDEEQVSMGEAFPLVFSAGLGQSFGALENGKVVSFVGLVPFRIHVGAAPLKVFAIGSVCTHPDGRGKGYAGAILQQVNRHIRQAGASLLLVSGDRSLYTRIHCYPFGTFRSYELKPEHVGALAAAAGGKGGPEVRELAPADWFALHELAAARPVRYEQSVTELAELIRTQAYASCVKLEHRTLVAVRDGKPVAFAVLAVPGRLQPKSAPKVIEWAGEAGAFGAILAEAMNRYSLEQLDLAVSWHETDLQQVLQGVPFQEERNSGTVQVTDPAVLLAQLQPYWRATGRPGGSELTATSAPDGSCELRLGADSVRVSPRELVSLLFDASPQLAERLPQPIAELFPIPFPYASGLNMI